MTGTAAELAAEIRERSRTFRSPRWLGCLLIRGTMKQVDKNKRVDGTINVARQLDSLGLPEHNWVRSFKGTPQARAWAFYIMHDVDNHF